MSIEERKAAADEFQSAVMAAEDPATWLIRARKIIEAAGLRPERCLTLPCTMQTLAWDTSMEAARQERLQELREACEVTS